MPPAQRGQAYRLAPGKWGLRYYDADGVRRRKSPFRSKSAALAHYRDTSSRSSAASRRRRPSSRSPSSCHCSWSATRPASARGR